MCLDEPKAIGHALDQRIPHDKSTEQSKPRILEQRPAGRREAFGMGHLAQVVQSGAPPGASNDVVWPQVDGLQRKPSEQMPDKVYTPATQAAKDAPSGQPPEHARADRESGRLPLVKALREHD